MIEKIKIIGSSLVELNYDLTINTTIKIPKNIVGAIVKVNVTILKGENPRMKISGILAEIQKWKPAIVFLGNVKTIIQNAPVNDKALSLNLNDEELVKEYIERFAPEGKKEKILEFAMEIISEARTGKNV